MGESYWANQNGNANDQRKNELEKQAHIVHDDATVNPNLKIRFGGIQNSNDQ